MNSLAIDTSTQTLGVAILKDNTITAEIALKAHNNHSSLLMPNIIELLKKADMTTEELDEIVIGNGPGSYTGTRISVTTGKTLAWALNIPIYTVSSLKLIAAGCGCFEGLICPFIDARRESVYSGLYRSEKGVLKQIKQEQHISMAGWLQELQAYKEPILFVSPDVAKYEEKITDAADHYLIPSASFHFIKPSLLFELADRENVVSVHAAVPNYLKKTEAEVNWLKNQEK